ncbi:NACHT, LRR and PYD domains-containing protein 3-like isoform X1 [Paramormyrops kingsleyae]|uniref:NACHT, LRR and PYD domains-containing protein 3-like isoform X1 n=1 Tax=Paramormyrops kingsleyae TaxID=1676925 RepID=UPI003B96D533
MLLPINFQDGTATPDRQNSFRARPHTPSSYKTRRISSKGRDLCEPVAAVKTSKLDKKTTDFLYNIFNDLENKMIVFIKHELDMFKKFLRKENTSYYGDVREDMWSIKEAALDMALYFLNLMEQKDLADALLDALIGFQQRALRSNLCKKFHHVCEGIAKQGESNTLNKIYTDLYMTTAGSGQMNEQHEVTQIEKAEKSQMEQEKKIECNSMFEPLPEEDTPRTVVTQGVAGIGKSICVQKFILDWAEEKEHQDIKFIFPLPFRELNLEKKVRSLKDIIYNFFPKVKGLRFTDRYKVLFIFDGLDECRLPLKFHENEKWTDASMPAPLDTILTNLIAGNLLPSALIWITTRPAAAAKIPAEHVHRVTEVRGFNDVQKVEYFKKKIMDETLANKIIDHLKKSRSLFIMCHIPVFCWISATVFEGILRDSESEDIPQTLTEMYTYFLIFQTVQGDKKFNRKNASDIPWDQKEILSLAKLAFSHLEKNNLIFYAEDLESCGLDPNNITVYSGLCTQETSRFLGTVFSFVHLSIQEFIAALHAYACLRNENKNVFEISEESKETKVIDVLKITVDKALESENGHLDLFLRFLLGLSLESNQKLIRGLLTHTGSSSDCQKDIVQYIKSKLEENPSPERAINLFYCLNELNDDSLVKEIQNSMSSGRLSQSELTPAQWHALVFVLLTSKKNLEVFELQKFIKSDECFKRLQPVVQEATTALLSECNLTERSCSTLHTVLSSESSKLTEVELSRNPLKDSGVKLLCAGLKSPNCKLEKLRLSDCSITEEGYAALAEALKSSHLIELDLRGNDPGASGVKMLTDLLQDPDCTLETLRLLKSDDAVKACNFLTGVLGKNPLLQTELDLSGKILKDSEVKQLPALLEDSHCRPEKLTIKNSGITEEACSALTSSFQSNPAHIRELDLSENKFENSGVKELCALLQHQPCKLQILRLSDCSITEEGYAALAEALTSSRLIELDLRGNDPGASGVKLLTDLLQDPDCTLETLRLLKSDDAVKACDFLTKVLGKNPLLQTELDLSGKILKDSEVKQLPALLEDSHCRPEKLTIKNSGITEEGCSALTLSFQSNPAHIRELDLSENKFENSGVKELCALLQHQPCKLQILRLSDCSITEEGYAALAEALKSSHLIELDLRGNDPGASGVKLLTDLQNSQDYKLEKLRLLKSPAAEKAFAFLGSILKKNPLLQRELDLSGKIKGDSGVKQLSALLEDSHCRPEILRINKCCMGSEGCSALASALGLNPSHLRELELSGNTLGSSGMKELCVLLNNKQFKLLKLGLCKCGLTEADCAAVVSALRTNPSHLKDLDLSDNTVGNTGVKELSALLHNSNCILEQLKLSKCSLTKTQCGDLAEVLKSNSSLHLKELDLRGNYSYSLNIFSDFLWNSNSKLIVR